MHPYYKAIIDAYAAAGRPYFHQVSPVEARAMMRASMAAAPPPVGLPELASVTNETIPGPHGDIPVRRYKPQGASPGICVFFHAGGWVIGDLDLSDSTCRRLAGAAQCEIVSVEYRKAPEHPFPQPLDDAYAALQWAARQNAGPVLLIGESAGGNLAAACAIRARDENGPKVVGQFLAYPVTDHDFQTASYNEVGDNNWLLSRNDMRWFWDQYAPSSAVRANPLLSPLHVANAAGLPPSLIYVAELDPLREEGLAYARKLSDAGVPVATRCDPEMLHGYLSAAGAIPQVAEALAEAGAWIKDRLAESRDMTRDLDAVRDTLARVLPQGDRITAVKPLTTGFSNETYFVEGCNMILRLPPSAGSMLDGHDVIAQARVYQALGETAGAPPVPKVALVCEDAVGARRSIFRDGVRAGRGGERHQPAALVHGRAGFGSHAHVPRLGEGFRQSCKAAAA